MIVYNLFSIYFLFVWNPLVEREKGVGERNSNNIITRKEKILLLLIGQLNSLRFALGLIYHSCRLA